MAYYFRAGQAAGKLYANAEASGHYQRALEIARRREAPNAELISIYTCLGRALELDNHYDQALGVYQELERLGRERGDDALVLAALNPMAAIYSVPTSKFSPEEGRKLSLDALGLARLLGDPRAEAKSLWNLLLIETFAAKDIAQALQKAGAEIRAYDPVSMEIARPLG